MRSIPPALAAGDRVAVVAPSSPADLDRVTAGCDVLRSWGLEPVLGDHLHDADGHLAGADLDRAADLDAAFRDPTIRAVWAARGGAGQTRILDVLDWQALARDPKLLIGFSDTSALHAAAWARVGVPTIHGQFVGRLHLQDAATLSWLQRLVTGDAGPGTEVPQGPEDDVRTVVGGVGEGRLVGGNLATLTALIGTPDELATDGCVLLLEEVNEPPYRIDRWLVQLLRCGFLDGVTGVVIGNWVGCEPDPGAASWPLERIVADLLGDLGVPVVTGWSLGHTDQQVALPLGTGVRLDGDAGRLTITEPVVGQRS